MIHVYVTETLDAAAWGADLAFGEGPGRIYLVEPTGDLEDDPNVTDRKFPDNPTRSYTFRPEILFRDRTTFAGRAFPGSSPSTGGEAEGDNGDDARENPVLR